MLVIQKERPQRFAERYGQKSAESIVNLLHLYSITKHGESQPLYRKEKNTAKNWLTDEEVEIEIERLKKSEAVVLARRKMRLEYRRRQVLYRLRDLEKKGKALMEAGITCEILDDMYSNEDDGE